MKPKIVMLGAVILAMAGSALGAAWLGKAGPFADKSRQPAAVVHGAAVTLKPDSLYVPLDKLIVMLHDSNGVPRSRYAAMDLVFPVADAKLEKQVRDQLPMLRSVAYRALSGYSADDIRGMSVDQLSATLFGAYTEAYGGPAVTPFSNVLIGKLMLE